MEYGLTLYRLIHTREHGALCDECAECSVFHLKTEADPTSEILYFFTAWDDESCLRSVCVYHTMVLGLKGRN